MGMTTEEAIAFLEDDIRESLEIMQLGVDKRDFMMVSLNAGIIESNLFEVGMLKWRMGINPSAWFSRILNFLPEAMAAMEKIDSDSTRLYPLDFFDTIYAAYLIGQPHPPVDLSVLEEQPKITGFFGNVLMGYADIAEWPQYRDAIPKSKRYDLARRTNELYAGLLAGNVSAEEGVKVGEQLWAEREDNTFFDTRTGGYGSSNETMVDYQLGAILKKIGSTVPTVHAWRW